MRTVERWRPFLLVVRTFMAAMISHYSDEDRLAALPVGQPPRSQADDDGIITRQR